MLFTLVYFRGYPPEYIRSGVESLRGKSLEEVLPGIYYLIKGKKIRIEIDSEGRIWVFSMSWGNRWLAVLAC